MKKNKKYKYILNKITNYDKEKYIPDEIVLLCEKEELSDEELYKIIISGENIDYLSKEDYLSFITENPEVLILNEKDHNKIKSVKGKTFFELGLIYRFHNKIEYATHFLNISRSTPYWEEILKTPGMLDTLFNLNVWNDIKPMFKREEMLSLQENSNKDAFFKYLKLTRLEVYYPYKTMYKDEKEKHKSYKEVREDLFKESQTQTVQNIISCFIKNNIKTNFYRSMSPDFFEDILKTESQIDSGITEELKKDLLFCIAFSKILNCFNISTAKEELKETELESLKDFLSNFIKKNNTDVLYEVLKEKKEMLSSDDFSRRIKEVILFEIVKKEKNMILEGVSSNSIYVKSQNRL